MTLNALQAAAAPRPQGVGRVAPRSPALAGPRIEAGDRRIQPRDSSTALPQAPARFIGPEDFKAYLDVVASAARALQAQASAPHMALVAAELAYRQADEVAGGAVRDAQQELAAARAAAEEQQATGGDQLASARQALDDARHPGRATAAGLQRELEGLQRRVELARTTIKAQQAQLDGGAVGPARARAYATIAQAQHAMAASQTRLDARRAEQADEAARVAPDFDPHVQAAVQHLVALEQALGGGRAEGRLEYAEVCLADAQHHYEEHVAPYRQELEQARAAYAPVRGAIDEALGRLTDASGVVTKTQRALWWARGFQLERMVAEAQAAAA